MELLKENCLLQIVNRLQLHDQISLYIALPTSQRVLHNLWREKYKKLYFIKKRGSLTSEQLEILIRNICDSVEEIEIDLEDAWDVLKRHSYPNVSLLNIFNFHAIGDQHISISEIFPNLASFKLSGVFGEITNPDIFKFKHLKHIDLWCSSEYRILEIILEDLPLLTSLRINARLLECVEWDNTEAFQKFCGLERINVESLEIPWLLELNKYTKLRELCVQFYGSHEIETKFFESLCKHKQKELIHLQIHTEMPFLQTMENAIFQNLKKLIVINNYIDDFRKIFKCAAGLRELIFSRCYAKIESIIQDLLNCDNPCLYISLEQCYFPFTNTTVDVEKLSWQRIQPLKFNFYNEEATLTIKGFSPFLIITRNQELTAYDGEFYALFEP